MFPRYVATIRVKAVSIGESVVSRDRRNLHRRKMPSGRTGVRHAQHGFSGAHSDRTDHWKIRDMMEHDDKWKIEFRRRLLRWYRSHARDLPWRRSSDPYLVWISEIMLQQTQVATVIPFYERFVRRFPTVASLASADEQAVLQHWEGLGYYRRARFMHRAAKQIVEMHAGVFPISFAEVLDLPGIGRYTAGAILSIALNQRQPILEGNTVRLFSRLIPSFEDPAAHRTQKKLWDFSESLLPARKCGDFNQALMELGSEICVPKSPACERCPVVTLCPSFAHGVQRQIPVAGKKTQYVSVQEAAVVVLRGNRVLVRQCGPDERWAGLFDFLRFEMDEHRSLDRLEERIVQSTGLTVRLNDQLQTIKHAVTRYRITLNCFVSRSVRGRITQANGPLQWVELSLLKELPLSVTGRKLAKLLLTKDAQHVPSRQGQA